MGVVNRFPAGFLGLLDAKTVGQTPSSVADQVQPTIEMRGFYESNVPLDNQALSEVGVTALGYYAEIPVADGEIWLVYGVQAEFFGATGDYARVAPVIRDLDQTQFSGTSEASTVVGTIGGTTSAMFFGEGIFVGAGTKFQCKVDDISLVSPSVSMVTRVMCRRLPS